jgi:hypothetical protein
MEELGSVEQSLESRKDFELLFADLIGNDTSTSISEYGSSPHDQSDRIEPHSKVFTPEFTVHTSTPESGPEILNPLQSIETIPISPRDKNEIFSILGKTLAQLKLNS